MLPTTIGLLLCWLITQHQLLFCLSPGGSNRQNAIEQLNIFYTLVFNRLRRQAEETQNTSTAASPETLPAMLTTPIRYFPNKSMAIQFEIESLIKITNRGCFVFARQLTLGQNFVVTDKSFLDGIELTKYLDIPMATNDKGEQRYDLFVFHLKNEEDYNKLKLKAIVELIPGDTLHYLKPWYSDDTDLTVQLHREINRKHILYGKPAKTIARRQDNDDVLFEVDKADFKYAMVHLTWAQKTLDDSKYPRTETYKDWQELYENRIIIDHQGWENE